MASRGYKKVITLGLDYSDFQGGVTAVNRQIRVLDSEFRNTSEKAKDFGTNIDKLGLKQEQLSQKVILQTQKVEILKKKYEESSKATGESSKATDDARIKYKDAETQLIKLQKSLGEVNKELNQQGNVFTKVAGNIENFKLKAEQSGINLVELGKSMQIVGATMTAAITLPLVAMGTAGTKAYMDFESAFTGVKKTVDATEAQFAALEKGIRSMAKEIPATAVEIAGVAEAAGQLGIKTDAILGFTRTMVDLGVATDLSSQQAATALAQLANITQMPQDQFDRLGSTIVALGNNLATTESKIVDMGLRLAGAGKQIGLTEAQILSFAGALSSVGIEAEAGGSAFSKLMVQMQLAVEKGGDSLKGFAKIAGVSTGEFKRMFKEDATSAIIAFVEGLGNAESKGKSAIAMLDDMGISEVRLRDALLRAAGAGDLFSDALKTGTQAWEENTALTKEAAQRYEDFSNKIQVFKNKLTDIAITIGESVVPVLSDMIDIMTPFAEIASIILGVFNMLPEPIRKVVVVALMLLAAVGPIVTVVGTLLTKLDGLGSTAHNTGKAFNAFSGFVSELNSPLVKALAIFLAIAGALAVILTLIAAIKGNAGQVAHIADSLGGINTSMGNAQRGVRNLPGYAVGTDNHPGGFAIVGERGPEIVELPRRSKVYTNEESRNMLSSGGDRYDDKFEKLLNRFDKMITATERMKTAYEDNRRLFRMKPIEG